jgi:oligopeptide/dipeptide ABC transporter ATP-binding protein
MDRVVVTTAGHDGGSGAAAPPPLVELRDIQVRYAGRRGLGGKREGVLAADGVNLTLARGDTLGIVGGTGSGKTTVANVIAGMIEPTAGTVTVDGRQRRELSRRERQAARGVVQIVPQDPYSSLNPRMTVGKIISEPLTFGNPFLGSRRRVAAADRVAELLGLIRLPAARAAAYPHQFSGGQRQRIAVARALAPRPELIVLDEPTSALDVSVRAQILKLLRSLQQELGVAYLVISHDLVTVAYLATTVAVMHLGRVVEIGPAKALYRSPRHPYTVELLASVPGADTSLLGQPRPVERSEASLPATACRFAYRCPLKTFLGDPERCLTEDPRIGADGPEHRAACHFSDKLEEFRAAAG